MTIPEVYSIINLTLFVIFLILCKDVEVIFKWYDIWVGVYYDKDKNVVYHFPLPMIGLKYVL